MAQSTEGLVAIGDYAGNDDTAGDAIDVLLALIADPDSTSTSGAQAGGGFLDEMSPAAAAQLRVELTALKAAIGLFDPPAQRVPRGEQRPHQGRFSSWRFLVGFLVFNLIAHLLGDSRICRSEEHTSELQSLMRISYAVFCL